jgi:hypothetical protein
MALPLSDDATTTDAVPRRAMAPDTDGGDEQAAGTALGSIDACRFGPGAG